MIPATHLDLFSGKKAFASLATVMPDGSPQVTPVWFDYEGVAKQVLDDDPILYLYHAKVLIAHTAKLDGYKQMPDGLVRVIGLKFK